MIKGLRNMSEPMLVILLFMKWRRQVCPMLFPNIHSLKTHLWPKSNSSGEKKGKGKGCQIAQNSSHLVLQSSGISFHL